MAFDGNGNFLRLHNWTSDAANNIDINAGEMDGEDNGFAAGLTLAVTRDGQGKMAADFTPSVDNVYNLGTGARRWASINGLPIASIISGIYYAQTTAEANAGVMPTVFTNAPGDLRRYGADPTGVLPSDIAIAAAQSCNSLVFDGYPGGGKYLFNTGVTITNFPVNFLGQAKNNKDVTGNAGTTFLLATAAGAAAAHFTLSYADGVRFQNIGFQWQSGNLSQFAIHVKTVGPTVGQLRSSVIDSCAFVGSGLGDTNCAIRIDSGTAGNQYSAFNTIRECYFSVVGAPIRMTGNATPMRVSDCDFLGHTGVNSINAFGAITPGSLYTAGSYFNVPMTGGSGTGAIANVTVTGGAVTAVTLVYGGNNYANTDTVSVAAANLGGTGSGFSIPVSAVNNNLGSAIQIDFPGEELKTRGNYFEGWTQGIYGNGAVICSHLGDEAQSSVYGYHWAQSGTHAFINNVEYGFLGVNGVAIGYTSLDLTQMQTSGPGGWLATGGAIQSTRGFQEGDGAGSNLRTAVIGYFTDVAPTLVANGGGSLSAVTINTFCYQRVGGTMKVAFDISATLTGAATTIIQMATPLGDFPIKKVTNACSVTNNGATAAGFAIANTSAAEINVQLANGGAFTAGAIAWAGEIDIRIIS